MKRHLGQYRCRPCDHLFRAEPNQYGAARCPRCDGPDTERGSHALYAAERKGREAALTGVRRRDNPYPDHRTDRGSVTFARGFRRAWFKGWDATRPTHGGSDADE